VPDIFDAAKKAGYTTAAVFWPCTGNHPSIDWLIDEYWTQRPGQTLVEAFAEMGACPELWPIIEKNAPLMQERKHPFCDDFMLACSCDMIRTFKPDFLMIHPANIDGARHGHGVFGEHIRKTLEDTDRWIGDLMEAASDAGVLEDTNFVLTSDHGQMDIKRVIHINVLLADAGLIRPRGEDEDPDWDAWCQSGGMSACVYLKDPGDRNIYEKTYGVLKHLCEEGVYGISRVYTAEEAEREEHYGGEFSFVLETDNYTSFGDRFVRPLVTGADNGDYRKGRATHGYLPSKGPSPVFYCKGPAFREDVALEEGKLIDEAPTIARAMGFGMPDTDGAPVFELLK
jgi:predicted AlkP superfamily pyrophosphatase or phosphodiesterase